MMLPLVKSLTPRSNRVVLVWSPALRRFLKKSRRSPPICCAGGFSRIA